MDAETGSTPERGIGQTDTTARRLSWRRLLWLVPLGLLGNLTYALLATDRQAMHAALDLNGRWLVVALLLAAAPILLNATRVWRWGRLLQPGWTWPSALRVVLIAEVGAAVTPTAIGGAPLKVAALARSGHGSAGALTMAALGSIEDALFITTAVPLAAIGSGLLPQFLETLGQALGAAWSRPAAALVVGAVVLLVGLVCLYRWRSTDLGARVRTGGRAWLTRLRESAVLVRRRGLPVLLGNVLLAGLQWTARLSILTALAAGLGAPLEPLRTAVLQWLCFTCMTMMPTPGAVGGAEAAFVLVFGPELPAALLPLCLAGWRLVTFYGPNAGGLLVLLAMSGDRGRAPGGRGRLADLVA